MKRTDMLLYLIFLVTLLGVVKFAMTTLTEPVCREDGMFDLTVITENYRDLYIHSGDDFIYLEAITNAEPYWLPVRENMTIARCWMQPWGQM